jgi:hypothetical protein
MSTIIKDVAAVRLLLVNPNEQSPSVDQIFNALLMEYQNLYNELSNTSQPWTTDSVEISLNSNDADYLINRKIGKVLNVTAYLDNANYAPVMLEFGDFAEVSAAGLSFFSPLYFGSDRDFVNWGTNSAPTMAFYRKQGRLYARVPALGYEAARVVITYAVGNWIEDISPESEAAMSEHHGLVRLRAAMNVLEASEWSGDREFNQMRKSNLDASFSRQEQRASQNLMLAKRSLTADHVTTRDAWEDCW